ncbi:MAG: hypothetical protein BWY52_01132 [Chloroflexi bacterium ADurb.Bin325]|nr:MAG: hypothetical protein BWY52_01132 [Chloroflexi bacterium ADurb.Bin325]
MSDSRPNTATSSGRVSAWAARVTTSAEPRKSSVGFSAAEGSQRARNAARRRFSGPVKRIMPSVARKLRRKPVSHSASGFATVIASPAAQSET